MKKTGKRQNNRPNRTLSALLMALPLGLPGLSWAGAHDYYECIGTGGGVTFSTERCPKGEQQRRIKDDTAPTSQSLGKGPGGVIVLNSERGGHFYTAISINGVAVRGVVDTGATSIALSPSAARKVGLDLQRGVSSKSYTANGIASVTGVQLARVEMGGHTAHNIVGTVLSQELGPQAEALIGMSFLKHFEVNTDGYRMTLRPK